MAGRGVRAAAMAAVAAGMMLAGCGLPSNRPDPTPAGVSLTVANETGAPLVAVVELAGGARGTYGLAAGATGVLVERATPGSIDAVVRFVTPDCTQLARQVTRIDAAVTLEVLSLDAPVAIGIERQMQPPERDVARLAPLVPGCP
jgi:hypothetical protein